MQESVEAPGELQDAPESSVAFLPWKKKEAISPLLTEEAVEEHQEYNLPLPLIDSVYILPSPASQSQHKTLEAPSTKATPSLPNLQNLKKLMAVAQIVATTSKKLAATHIAWHSGWLEYGFGFGAPEPRHFYALPHFFLNFSCFILFYRILFDFDSFYLYIFSNV